MFKKKILIVEDNALIGLDLKRILQKLGFEITHVVSNYEMVLKSIEKVVPDLVLMDIYLNSEKNGIEIAIELNKLKKIPILYLTAYSDDNIMKKAFQTNPFGYLVKPYKEEELKAMINLIFYKIRSIEEKVNHKFNHIGCDYYFDIKNQKLYYKNSIIKIGMKEKKLLELLTKANGEFVTHSQLEHYLWSEYIPSHSSLRTLIYRLKSKLGCNIIEALYGMGYKLNINSIKNQL